MQQQQQRQDNANEHPAQDTRAKHPDDRCYGHGEFAFIEPPKALESIQLKESGNGHQDNRRQNGLRQVTQEIRKEQRYQERYQRRHKARERSACAGAFIDQ